METNESRGSRLMRKLGGLKGEDMGAGAGGNMGGNTVGGDAGLSQLGSIPNGPLGIVKGRGGRAIQRGQRRNQECECGASLTPGMVYCPECGAQVQMQMPMNASPQERYSESFEERFNNYLEQQKTGRTPQRLQVQPQLQQETSESVSAYRFDEVLAHVMRVEEKLEALYALVESLQQQFVLMNKRR